MDFQLTELNETEMREIDGGIFATGPMLLIASAIYLLS